MQNEREISKILTLAQTIKELSVKIEDLKADVDFLLHEFKNLYPESKKLRIVK